MDLLSLLFLPVLVGVIIVLRAWMRLRDMPLHADLLAACGEPQVGAVPLPSTFRAATLPAMLLLASMALPAAAVWSFEHAQALDRGAAASAPGRTHP